VTSFPILPLGSLTSESTRRLGQDETDIPIYGVDKEIGLTKEPRYKSANISRYKIVEEGMFAYNPMRLNINSIGYCDKSFKRGGVSPDYVVFACDPEKLDHKFFFYHTKSATWRKWLELAGEGSVRERIYYKKLSEYELTVPPVLYQKSAARILSALDDKIELNRLTNDTLAQMAQAIFKDWFVDFGPVRRKQEGATDPIAIMGGLVQDSARAAKLAELFPNGFCNNGLPNGWRHYSLSQLASQTKRAINPSTALQEVFEHYSLPAYDSGEAPTLDRGATILSNKTLIPPGAVLLSKLNPEISRVWVPNDREDRVQIASTEFLVLQPLSGIKRALLQALFRSMPFRTMIEGMVTGTSKSHQRVSPTALFACNLLAGSSDAFAAFGDIGELFMQRRLALRRENQALTETRDYLLSKLISGEVRVRDADSLVGSSV
jgi:type I restriction enzyme, S subunit